LQHKASLVGKRGSYRYAVGGRSYITIIGVRSHLNYRTTNSGILGRKLKFGPAMHIERIDAPRAVRQPCGEVTGTRAIEIIRSKSDIGSLSQGRRTGQTVRIQAAKTGRRCSCDCNLRGIKRPRRQRQSSQAGIEYSALALILATRHRHADHRRLSIHIEVIKAFRRSIAGIVGRGHMQGLRLIGRIGRHQGAISQTGRPIKPIEDALNP
jgi:hypothetical protein